MCIVGRRVEQCPATPCVRAVIASRCISSVPCHQSRARGGDTRAKPSATRRRKGDLKTSGARSTARSRARRMPRRAFRDRPGIGTHRGDPSSHGRNCVVPPWKKRAQILPRPGGTRDAVARCRAAGSIVRSSTGAIGELAVVNVVVQVEWAERSAPHRARSRQPHCMIEHVIAAMRSKARRRDTEAKKSSAREVGMP